MREGVLVKAHPPPPHLTGWCKDSSIYETTVMPASIKLWGSFELMGGLALQTHKCSDEQLLALKRKLSNDDVNEFIFDLMLVMRGVGIQTRKTFSLQLFGKMFVGGASGNAQGSARAE